MYCASFGDFGIFISDECCLMYNSHCWSIAALKNLEAICEEHLAGRYRIEVIDLLKQPQLARGDQIVAVPTLVRHLPPPMKKIIGDLSNADRVLVGLDLRQRRRRAGALS